MTNHTLRAITTITAAAALVLATTTPAAADTIRDQQWHLTYLKVDQLHAITQGEGVTVAVIDSGVDATHPDLVGNVLRGDDQGDRSNPQPWRDDRGHGTAMASIIAGHGHGQSRRDGILGIAPAAKILPIKIPNKIGDDLLMADAIRWAVDQGAEVVNISRGNEIVNPDVRDAIRYALDSNVVVVSSVGNTAQGHEAVTSPASVPGVVAVSGTDKKGRFTKESVEGPEVVIAAPAVDIIAADAGEDRLYESGTGTSNAAAIVSGVAALIRAKYPKLNAASIIDRLITTATDKGPEGRDPQYGYGVVNPLAALTKDVPEVDHNPLLPPPPNTPNTEKSIPTGAIVAFTVAGFALVLAILGVIILIRRSRRRTAPLYWR